jgi:hypothetical protein
MDPKGRDCLIQEDNCLIKLVNRYSTKNWSTIATKLCDGTAYERTGKQCRERWYNQLQPQIYHT